MSNQTPRSIPPPAHNGNNLVSSPTQQQALSYTEEVKDFKASSDPFGNI